MTLAQISHSQLLDSALKLALQKDSSDVDPLNEYLQEIERRKLHLELGFKNASDFFSAELGICGQRFAPNGAPRRHWRTRLRLTGISQAIA